MREASVSRSTKETSIDVTVNLDGTGQYTVNTGIGFLDHMLEQLSRHSLVDLTVEAKGDLHIDFHHTTEDVGICVGEAVAEALGDRTGITRYGSAVIPMDETLTEVAIDLSNRPYLIWKADFSKPKLATWIRNCSKNGSRLLPRRRVRPCMCRTSMVKTIIILLSHVLRGWPDPYGWR